MSTREVIVDWVQRRALFEVTPTLPNSPHGRWMFANAEVNRLIVGPWADQAERYRCGALWADFDRYVESRIISVCLDNPYRKPKTTFLARLDPGHDEVWEIRSRDPRPSIRVFGRFADRDVFVALDWGHRSQLGGPGSNAFKLRIRRCKAEWRKLFPSYDPLTGSSVNEYISENAFPV